MSPLVAAMVLAWIVIVILAFAMAGILQRVRSLNVDVAELQGARRSGTGAASIPAAVLPRSGAAHSAVLLVSEGCAVCAEVLPEFTRLSTPPADGLDFVVVTWSSSDVPASSGSVRWINDGEAYRSLDPGWTPAFVVVDDRGVILAREPAGSTAAVAALVAGTIGAPR